MKILSLTQTALAVASAAAMLAACGDSGGLPATGDGANQPPLASSFVQGSEVPITATTSAMGATDFIKSIVTAGGSETKDPLVDGNAILAVSELDEPDPTI